MDESVSDERWLPVVGYEGLYEVSDLGRVRSIDRVVAYRAGHTSQRRGVVLKTHPNPRYGYLIVHFWRDNSKVTRTVHAIVLEAFVGPRPSPQHEGCHNDGNPANNRVDNLRWDTKQENRLDIVRHGRHNMSTRKRCPRRHELNVPNLDASALRKGSRKCLACTKAWKYLDRRGLLTPERMQAESDRFYAEIMRDAA